MERYAAKVYSIRLSSKATREAANIIAQLKTKRKTIDKPDLFIAATAVVNELTLDTLNIRHFVDIDNLKLLTK